MAPVRGGVVITQPRPITDEPVRGVVPPAWIFGLTGIEHMRVLARGLVPMVPVARMFGLGIGHVSAGALTGTMKASGHLVFIPVADFSPLSYESLYGAAMTAAPAGFSLSPITVSTQYFRPSQPQPGNFLGRARVHNSSSLFVASTVDIEDPIGRLVGHATSQWAVKALDPPPPAPPATIEPSEEPRYATPDPPDRPPVGSLPPTDLGLSGLEISRMVIAGELPTIPWMHTTGMRWLDADEGIARLTVPASEWFCSDSRAVFPAIFESMMDVASVLSAVTLWEPGQSVAVLESSSRFLRSVPADGRLMTARGRVTQRVANLVMTVAEAIDSDGNLVAEQNVVLALLDPRDRRRAATQRVLATLLFTDVVGSTQQAEKLGDAAWKELLEEHHALVRRELGAHHGIEMNTTGDGVLSRFESPASAVRCAQAIRDGVKRLRLEIRAGVHTGECEVRGADLAGIAVHVGARIGALAEPNEILVSQTVRDLTAGSGLRFTARGAHELKGVEGKYNLYALEN